MMENIQLSLPEQEEYMNNFMAMLEGDNVTFNGIPNHTPAGVETLDAKFDDEILALALSPMDPGSEEQNQFLPKIDLQMIHDIIGSEDMQVDPSVGTVQVTTSYSYPDSSPQLYDTSCGFAPQQQHGDEVLQTVPVHNPTVMLSGAIPQPQPQPLPQPIPQPIPQPMTIDPSQIMENPTLQAISADPSESMSMDPSEVNGSVTDESIAQSPQQMDEAKMEENPPTPQTPRPEEPPKLPDIKELLVRIRYRSQEVAREHIRNPNGCLVYHSKPWNFQVLQEVCPAGMKFPDISNEEKDKMTESQYKFTVQVLNALEKGLFLECDNHGNVYATRFCRSKIFWYSTEQGPIADAQISQQAPNLKFQKLERNEKVMVFDNILFQKKLLHYVVNKPTFKHEAAKQASNQHCIPISPAIFFTFAQSWNPMNSALSSCLVSMVVNPVRARMQRQWGNEDRHESYDLSNYRPQISMPSEASE